MKTIYFLYKILQLGFYGFLGSILPTVSHAGLFPPDKATEEYKNWACCLKLQSYYRQKNKLGEHIQQYGCKWGKWVTFPDKILAISLKVGQWDNPEDLFASQDFIAMYKHPAYYWKHAIDYLANPIYSENHKKIVIYGLENLGYSDYLSFAQACYTLYQEKQLSEPLFEMVLSCEFLGIHPLVTYTIGSSKDLCANLFLVKVQSEVSKNSSIKSLISEILSGRLANNWKKKQKSAYLHYKDRLPFADIIHKAHKETKLVFMEDVALTVSEDQPYQPPYFLMIYDHPSYYSASRTLSSSNVSSDSTSSFQPNSDIEAFLTDLTYTIPEKRLAVFAMQQLDSRAYARFIKRICLLYNWHPSLLYVMEDLICCRLWNLFHQYPFFILDHRDNKVQEALDKLLEIPSLTCGIHFIIKKTKLGLLATFDQTNRIRSELKLHKARFRLYETIGPLKSAPSA